MNHSSIIYQICKIESGEDPYFSRSVKYTRTVKFTRTVLIESDFELSVNPPVLTKISNMISSKSDFVYLFISISKNTLNCMSRISCRLIAVCLLVSCLSVAVIGITLQKPFTIWVPGPHLGGSDCGCCMT